MKILIDINHPAHVHYFKNFIKIMEDKGHVFKIVNRDSKMINQLLDIYKIPHSIRKGRPKKKGTVKSLVYLLGIVKRLISESIKFRPDMYVGFASSACAITASLFRKPSILIDDTEHNVMNHLLYKPFCSVVLTPFYFRKNLGSKQLSFQAFIEQFYLHSKYYSTDSKTISDFGLSPKSYVLVRYIAYDAHHDLKATPIPERTKREIVEDLAKQIRVIVSHENEQNDGWYKKYQISFSPDKMHDLEANALFMISEGATMASESFVLGVPFAYINPLKVGNVDYDSAHYPNVAFSGNDIEELKERIEFYSNQPVDSDKQRIQLEELTIDPTDFLVWFVENYPQSHTEMKKNPMIQQHFSNNPEFKIFQ